MINPAPGPRRFQAKRIKSGLYEYRGLIVRNHGYYPPDQCVWWEAFNPNTGEAEFHAHTLYEIKAMIDEDYK